MADNIKIQNFKDTSKTFADDGKALKVSKSDGYMTATRNGGHVASKTRNI